MSSLLRVLAVVGLLAAPLVANGQGLSGGPALSDYARALEASSRGKAPPTVVARDAVVDARLDLSGTWDIDGGGEVTFTGRSASPSGDGYTVAFEGESVSTTVSGSFDGRALTLQFATTEPVVREGAIQALDRAFSGDPAESREEEEQAPAEVGVYGFTRDAEEGIEEQTFQAKSSVSVDGPTPVAVFRRVQTGYAVKDLRLEAGSTRSRSYAPDASGSPQATADGSDEFHFAPGAESVAIRYTIVDTKKAITAAVLELSSDALGDTVLWSRRLAGKTLRHGKHRIRWSGKVGEPSETFPHGLVTLEHSGYTLRLRVTEASEDATPMPNQAWTRFQVRAHGIALKLGRRRLLSDAKDLAAYESLKGKLPAEGARSKVFLLSNQFKTDTQQMYDNSAHDAHAVHGAGPGVPIIAEIELETSAGAGVKAPKALGDVPVRWKAKWVAADAPVHAGAKAYVEASERLPLPDSHWATFPTQTGLDGAFPFAVEPAGQGEAISRPQTTGRRAGQSGVIVRLGRMAGSGWIMTASIGEPESGGVEAKTGTLEVWRDVTIARIARKNASVSELNLARLGGEFDDAALRLGGGEVRRDLFKSKEFNAAIEAAFDALPDWHQRLTKPAVDQSASGACAVNFLSYDDWTAAWKKYVKEHSKDEPRLALWSPPTDMQNSFGYQRWCKQMGPKVLKEASASWAGPEGVTIVQFSGVTNFDAFVGIPFYGWAPSVPGLDGSQAVLFLTVGPSELSGTRWTLEDVAGHEIGHQLFLPHGKGGGGSDQTLHDQRWAPCLMSYEDDDLRVCGVCVLRLRGWSNSDATRVPVAASETLPTADTSLTKMDR